MSFLISLKEVNSLYNQEFLKYNKFISDSFPKSVISEQKELEKIYNLLYQDMLLIDFASLHDLKITDERKQFYNDFTNIILRILYHLPLKDIYVNRILTRTLAECTAKITLTYFSEITDIQQMSMKLIKEELKKKGVHVKYKDFYETITSFFGEYSTDVHGRNISTHYDNSYLYQLLNTDSTFFINDLIKIHEKLNKGIISCFSEQIEYDKSTANIAKFSSILEMIL